MTSKRPTKVCQYAENCYRKNPIHFGEFAHPHLDDIYDKGFNESTGEYTIPDRLLMSKDVILLQLKLLEKLFPKAKGSTKKTSGETPTTCKTAKEKPAERIVEGGGYVLGSSKTEPSKMKSDDGKFSRGRSPQPVAGTSKAATTSTTDGSNLSKKPKINRDIKDYIPVVLPKGQAAAKLEKAAPYNMFLTAITNSKPTHSEPLTITLQEILDESLGEIEMSLQINFMVDIGWLLGHYYFAGILEKPLIVLYGDETPELKTISQHKPQVTAIKVNMPTPFATSHTKMMLFGYKDGSMRVVISTANMYEDDWHNRTQGLWISPKLPALPEGCDTSIGESKTNFRSDLMFYLVEYKLPKLQPWMARIRKTDFSEINVYLIASVPGGHREGNRGHPWGHARLGQVLSNTCAPIDENCPIVCQSSSIGSLGPNVSAWIQNDFLNSLRKDLKPLGLRRIPQFKMIYPSYGNVKNSHDDLLGGGCLPYGKNVDDKQPWLREHLHQWKSKARHRSQAMPHIKSYTRWSDEGVYWFVLTSANLSKAAWGAFNKNTNMGQCLRIANFEAGVLFVPKVMIGENTFPMNTSRNGVPPFPMPYDVPLTKYGPDDKPFLMDYLRA
ncbi:probable tyrosyl-DNA phosphodiesterase [Episyrphus balteatus]|uniref:probable tyrosyl-DNA phosphodiesterase n=1 Tax=Episyrphus balteatus TaxID=286459 RepID=UPI0024868671|nr:probable tyrosyl-DNA phosphodiesterase [Episyrphus balteatus]